MSIHQLVKRSILRTLLKGSVFPDQYNPPKQISKEGLEHWPKFWKKHGEKILESGGGDLDKTWAATVAFFSNSCMKRNIDPFVKTDKVTDTKTREYMKKRFRIGRQNSIKSSSSIIKSLLKSKTVVKVSSEEFYKVYYSEAKKQISFLTVTKLDLKDTYLKLKDFITKFLKDKGFEAGKHFLLRDKIIDIIISVDETSKKRLNVYTVIHFTPAHVKFIVSKPESEIDTIDKLLLAAKDEFQLLIKQTPVGMIGSFINPFNSQEWNVDFNVPLTEEEQNDIFEIIKNVDKSTEDRFTDQFCIDYLVASDTTPQYKYQLIKALIVAFEAHDLIVPLSWKKAAENPDDYFNPFFYKKRIQQEELEDEYSSEE